MRRYSIILVLFATSVAISAAVRVETFDRQPTNWEGVNNRSRAFEPKKVVQDFGYSPDTSHAGGAKGEIGGRIQPAGEPAYYAFRLPKPLDFSSSFVAEGRLHVARGSGHCMFGFFNTNTINEWRTPNSITARINARGDTFECHLEYCTRLWRAGAGVIGIIVPGQRIDGKPMPGDKSYAWKLEYARGRATLTLDGDKAETEIPPEHLTEGATFTHFGLLTLVKTWDTGSDIWLDDVNINGTKFAFDSDPKWEAFQNRRTYTTTDTRPRFDFGWSPTHHAKGKMAGELGGLIFRGDCREPARMACYGDRLGTLTLKGPLRARGKVCMLRGVTDSTASIGFYHATHSMQSNRSQKNSVPMDYLGINIEGPSSEGFFLYPVFRAHDTDGKALGANGNKSPRIYPDGKVREWSLEYDPGAANGHGRITVSLEGHTCMLDLDSADHQSGATFNRFGICTPWIDGNSVTVYFDDLEYTAE